MAGIPRGDWLSLIDLQILQWTPFVETGRYVSFAEQGVMVWIWDNQAVSGKLKEHQLSGDTLIIPEDLYIEPIADGIRLLKMEDGFEAQVWVNTELVESIHWPFEPTPQQLKLFQANFPKSDLSSFSEPLVLPWREDPWGRNRAVKTIKIPKELKGLGILLAGVYWLVLSWQLLNIGLLWVTNAKVSTEIAESKAQISEILDARESAFADLERIKYLTSNTADLSQTLLLTSVLEKIPRNGVTLNRWQYQEGSLTLILKGSFFDPRYYVKAFEGLPFIESVSTQTDQARGLLTLKATVKANKLGTSDTNLE